MLSKISMEAVACFNSPTVLETDKKINLVYGLNGTGKSTLSGFLYSPNDAKFEKCHRALLRNASILVYNQAFVRENFYTKDSLKGIFSLSKENKEAEQKIERALAKVQELEGALHAKSQEKSSAETEFGRQRQKAVDEIWTIKTTYSGGDRVLEYCLEGLKGQKDRLFGHLLAVQKPGSEPSTTVAALRAEVESLQGDSAQPQEELQEPRFAAHDVEQDPVFQKTIIGSGDSAVAGLIESLGNSDWVRTGLVYIPKQIGTQGSPCPFCQEPTITADLVASINGYFDTTYETDISYVSSLRQKYQTALSQMRPLADYVDESLAQTARPIIEQKYAACVQVVQSNLSQIDEKLKTPRAQRHLRDAREAFSEFNREVATINEAIRTYNAKLADRNKTLEGLKTRFWELMRWQYDQTLTRYLDDMKLSHARVSKAEAEINGIQSDIAAQRKLIVDAQKETVNIEEAVAAINGSLVELGIDGFRIARHSETLYQVARVGQSGDAFHTLSEGERMIISFLYFCELCKGRHSADAGAEDRVVVIDDPISSLSHVFIFNVGQMIRSLFFKSPRFCQVFVLTHSLYFFYELTDTNHDRRKRDQKLFRICKDTNGSRIEEMKYEEIQNDYQSYWSVINDPNQHAALIANCMRNIVEYFFNFVRKRDLNNVFQMDELQENRFQAFCRYINRESHSLGQNILDLKEFDYGSFREGLRLVFEKAGYAEHFNAMAKL
jgi:wobble nucleotide-excising tRNase